VGVRLENGEEHHADHVVSAADGHATIFDILEGKYIDDTIRGYYEKLPVLAPLVYIGLGVDRVFDDLPQMVEGLVLLLDEPLLIGGTKVDRLTVHPYNFDVSMAWPGKTSVTLLIHSDYAYWKSLRADIGRYREEKARTAEAVIKVLDQRFPGLAAQVEMVDVATPATFERYTGNWQGSYEGWLMTPKTLMMNMKKTLPGLDNFYMANQWVTPGGGLCTAMLNGRQAVQLVCHRDRVNFTASKSG
jgi:phytoene dehydrogenase-like protein